MIKKILLSNCQKKINSLKPLVDIHVHEEIPTPSAKELAALAQKVSQVNAFQERFKEEPHEFFKAKTEEYRKMILERTKDLAQDEYQLALEAILDEILPPFFAMVREAAERTVKMRHFDVQIAGGIALHKNKIAEMATGEGKTLVATLAASLNALAAGGVHVVTVNDYLARRDREWMGPVYEYLGLSVGVIQQDMMPPARKQAYSCDITYGTNNEFGFDYLRDNMVSDKNRMVQRGHFYAIVDEVDSILIDEARTPLIISGPTEVSTGKYYMADRIVRQLKKKVVISLFENKEGIVTIKNLDGSEEKTTPHELEEKFDAVLEEKSQHTYLTKRGEEKCERMLGVKSVSEDCPDKFSNTWAHYINQGLRAHQFFKPDQHYIVKDGKVLIVDEFTGRLMPGRRWSDGLHQLVEAKENLKIQEESQTLATVTLQNYFRMYAKAAGMTGTAYTEAAEFKHIYHLETIVIPPNRPLIRANQADRIYKTKRAKFDAVVAEIVECFEAKRPILVGTTSIEDSEGLSFMLQKKGINHNVLNAKYHEREAHIVAQAGRLGQVTIATNMAGRGTDIILGGNIDYFIKDLLAKNDITPEAENYQEEYERLYDRHRGDFQEEHRRVVELGGLHVIGTQRHEARRIDNQLRGRSGRQGDPGSSRFYISLQDDLMRLFASDRIYFFMEKVNFPEDQPIEHTLVNHSIAVAQKKVEGHNFEIRKDLLKFDDVINKQREVIYKQRREILERDDIKEEVVEMIADVLEKNIALFLDAEADTEGLTTWYNSTFNLHLAPQDIESLQRENISTLLQDKINEAYESKEREFGHGQMRQMERMVSLWTVDSRWKEHLLIMDSLKEGIHLRGYAHVDPLVAYQKEAYDAFGEMIDLIKENVVATIFKTKLTPQKEIATVFSETPKVFVHSEYSSLHQEDQPAAKPQKQPLPTKKKVGRNEPCPCGSGKKYKKCCGQ